MDLSRFATENGAIKTKEKVFNRKVRCGLLRQIPPKAHVIFLRD